MSTPAPKDAPAAPPAPAPAVGAPSPASTAESRALCILCRAGDERVAVRTSDVQKVTTIGHVSRLPRLPESVVGITQHRGRVVTVVDAGRALFPTLAAATTSTRSTSTVDERLLILERPARHIGLRVDAVDEIEELTLPRDLPAGPSPALRVVQHRGRALPLVDLDRFAQAIGVVDARPPRRS